MGTQTRPGVLYLHCRHLSLLVLGGSIFLFITDLFPFMFSFNLSFEYGCLFYPAFVSFIFSAYATSLYWRKELLTENIPTMIAIGWVAVLFMLLQFLFSIVADSMYHFEVIMTGSGFMNAATLFFVFFRLWSIPHGLLIIWLCRWSNIMYKNPGAEQEFLYAMKSKGRMKMETESSVGHSESYGKAQEATV